MKTRKAETKVETGALSDDQLDAVSGGDGRTPAPTPPPPPPRTSTTTAEDKKSSEALAAFQAALQELP